MVKGEAPLDIWSWAHLASGAGLAVVGLSPFWAVVVLVGFEVLEAGLRLIPTGDGPPFQYETFANIVADVILGLIGYVATLAITDRFALRRLWPFGPRTPKQ